MIKPRMTFGGISLPDTMWEIITISNREFDKRIAPAVSLC